MSEGESQRSGPFTREDLVSVWARPAASFCAVDPDAKVITSDHGLAFGFDETSPLAVALVTRVF